MHSRSSEFGPLGFLAATQQGLPITEPIQDKTPIGSFYARTAVAIGTTPTTVAIQLPRLPSVFIANTNNGAVVFQTSADVTASTSAAFVCRATSATTANTLLVA